MAINNDQVDSWARFALTGSPTGDDPESETLDFLRPTAIAAVVLENPCTADSTGTPIVTGAEALAFEQAAGYRMAKLVVRSPAGASYAGNIIKLKIGTFEKTANQNNSELALTFLNDGEREALARIACVAASLKTRAAGFGPGLVATGKRRTTGDPRCLRDIV